MQTDLDDFNLLKDLQDLIRDLKLLRKKVYNKEAWRSNARSVLFHKYFERNKELKKRYENMAAKQPMNKKYAGSIPLSLAIKILEQLEVEINVFHKEHSISLDDVNRRVIDA